MGSAARLKFYLGLLLILLISGISGAMSDSGVDSGVASGLAPEKAAPADLPPRGLGGRGFGGEKIKSWPELVGKDGEHAKKHISEEMPALKQVIVLPQMEVFVAWYDYAATKTDELNLKANDEVIVLDKSGGDWWLGRNRKNNEEGWFPKDYGEIKGASKGGPGPKSPPALVKALSPAVNQASPASPAELRSPYLKHKTPRQVDASTGSFRNKDEVFVELVASEERYHTSLKTFCENFLTSVKQRDCEEKRKLCYGQKNVAVALELMPLLLSLHQRLLHNLKHAGNDATAVARAILSFAPANRVYMQYAANQLEVPAGLEKLGSPVAKWLKENPLAGGLTLLRHLSLPVERLPMYYNFLALAGRFLPDNAVFAEALHAMDEGLDGLEATVAEHQRQAELVELQAQFMGYVDMYAPSRRLVREGTLKKIYIDASGRKPQDRHVHLFNDALIYSSKLIGPYKYKLAKSFDMEHIKEARILPGDPTMFDLIMEDGHDHIRLQGADEHNTFEWTQVINKQISDVRARMAWDTAHGKPIQSREERVNIIAFLRQQGLDVESLPERSKQIVYGLKADFTYAEYIKVFAKTVAVTLDEIGRGIGSASAAEFGDQERGKGLFDTKTKAYTQATEGTKNRMKVAASSKPLQSAEMATFLKLVPILSDLTASLVDMLEERLKQHAQTGSDLIIGPVYLDLAVVFRAYETYSSVLFEAMDVLSSATFAELMGAMSDELAPLTIEQHLQAPLEAARRMAAWLRGVLEMTPKDHPDHGPLESAAAQAEHTVSQMEQNEQDVKDYWRLVAVRESMTSMEFKDSRLDTLINNTRKLVHEGVLTKVCRGKNKPYMFWLLTDCLIYATNLPGGSYTFNRWMELTEMRVEANATEPLGLDILTASKSFTVLCMDDHDKNQWIRALKPTILAAKEASNIDPLKETWQAAPLLVQTSERNDCTICHAGFSLFKSKHHCLKCGIIVCDKCSPNRMTLPNIHKTQKQRVCNICMNHIVNETEAPQARGAGAARTVATPVSPRAPSPTEDLLDSSDSEPAPAPVPAPAPSPRSPAARSPVPQPQAVASNPFGEEDWAQPQQQFSPPPPVSYQSPPPVPPRVASPGNPFAQGAPGQFSSPAMAQPNYGQPTWQQPQQQPGWQSPPPQGFAPKSPVPGMTSPAAFDAFDAVSGPSGNGMSSPVPQPMYSSPVAQPPASSAVYDDPFDF